MKKFFVLKALTLFLGVSFTSSLYSETAPKQNAQPTTAPKKIKKKDDGFDRTPVAPIPGAIPAAGANEAYLVQKRPSPVDLLYKVSISDSIQRSVIIGKHRTKNLFKFSTKSFSLKTDKYNVFLVLNDLLNGVIAEIVVTKVQLRQKEATATLQRGIAGLNPEDLVGRTIIRIDDLKQTMSDSLLFRSNALVSVLMSRSNFTLASGNILTGNELNAPVIGYGAALELFAPKSGGIDWINWFGLRAGYMSISPTLIVIKAADATSTQEATLSGSRLTTEVIIQPWLQNFVIYHASLLIGVQNSMNEKIDIVDPETPDAEPRVLTLNRGYSSIGLELAINPIPHFYGGFTARSSPIAQFVSTDSSFADVEATGSWQSFTADVWASLLYPMSDSFKFNLKFLLRNQTDTISDAPDIGSGEDHQITDTSSTLELGIVFNP